jgi:nucleoside-diphosphate-sugar epimerase
VPAAAAAAERFLDSAVVIRVLVLGGTGFVGPFIVKQLVERGHEVTLFHRGHHEPPLTEGARHVHDEFARLPEHVSDLARREPDVVIDVSPGRSKGGHGVLHFAEIARRGVVLTSMDVYRAMSVLWGVEGAGPPQPMPVTEESELRTQPSPDLTPEVDFDNLAVEQAVGAAEFPVTVVRCPVIYGPLDTQRRLRPYVRRMADARPAIVLDSRLARLRMSRGYVENVAQAVVAAASDGRAAGRTYNVGEPDALSEAEWVRAIGDELDWQGEVVVADPAALPAELHVPLPAQDLFGDTSRIRRELGYVESVSRSEGLRRAIEWERAQQDDEPPPDYAAEDAALRHLLC